MWCLLVQALRPAFGFARQGMARVPFGKETIGRLAIVSFRFVKLLADRNFGVARRAHDTAGSGRCAGSIGLVG